MSYEIPGFDPTSLRDDPELPFSVWHDTINHIGVHVVHPEELYRRMDAGQKVTLVDDNDFARKGNIKSVEAVVRGGKNYADQDASLYDATITLRKERDWSSSFLSHVDDSAFSRLKAVQFFWGGTRLLERPGTNLIMSTTVFSDHVILNNQYTGSNSEARPLRETRLRAPANKDVSQGAQLSHAFDCISAMMCVAYSLGKDKIMSPSGTLIVTPDGPLYKNPDTGEYVHRLGREQIATTSGVKKTEQKHPGLDQLFGIEPIKEQLRPLIVFYKQPEVAKKWRVERPGNILLHGPAGTGKTAIAHALASDLGADLYEISPADIYGKWMGDSERAIKNIFDKVRNVKKPTILLLDEMEGIISVVNNDSSAGRANNAVAGIFKTESARITTENPNVILVATTNDTSRLDPALIRAGRFDVSIAMSLPNDDARRQMYVNLILNNHSFGVDGVSTEGEFVGNDEFNPYDSSLLDADAQQELVRLTDHNFSAADIIESLRRACLAKADEEERTGAQPEPIDITFLSKVITVMRRNRV